MKESLLFTRREFLRTSSLVAVAAAMPSFLVRTAAAAASPHGAIKGFADGRILVVIQLGGGNDGLNTLVPYSDDAYHRARPRLGLKSDRLITIDSHLAMNDQLKPLKELYDQGFNRVTDTAIPETVMRHLEQKLLDRWKKAADTGERKFESEYLQDIFANGAMEEYYQIPAENSWLLAAWEKGIPVYHPGWEDSTTGNMFAAAVFRGEVKHHQCVKSGTEQMEHLMRWYLDASGYNEAKAKGKGEKGKGVKLTKPSVGFFQIGGGIAGDFAICAVPAMVQDLQMEDVPFWGYFAQISDASTSYGGYSGAVPNEKITWGKLDVDTPKFMIQSDATIVAPLIFGYLLND